MPNITVTVDETIYKDARVFAARNRTSVSAIVEFCLQNLGNLRFGTEAVVVMARNRQAAKATAQGREQARRAARVAAFQAALKSAQSNRN
ncbi:MAG: hypothetical protein ABR928_01710 [Terracidiphilus sp.]|jgi:hypothetical protein